MEAAVAVCPSLQRPALLSLSLTPSLFFAQPELSNSEALHLSMHTPRYTHNLHTY